MIQNCRLILASASPRRRQLLEQAGYTFEIIPSKKEEIITKTVPSEVVMELAAQKAEDIFSRLRSGDTALPFHTDTLPSEPFLVIGSDTVVSYQDRILGKPSDSSDAQNTLNLLSGRTHQVYTGVALYYFNPTTSETKKYCFFEKTDVTFYDMDESEIVAYISTGDPLDKAGSYGIQGPFAIHVKEIHGDYNNVVGLPLARLYHEMKKVLSN